MQLALTTMKASDIVAHIVSEANRGLGRTEVMSTDEALKSWGLWAQSILALDGDWEILPKNFMPLSVQHAGVYVYGEYLHIVGRGMHDSASEARSFLFNRVT